MIASAAIGKRGAAWVRQGTLLAGLVAASATSVHANGRPLRSVDIQIRPDHPDDILIAATIGMILSHDGGVTWRWMCEAAIGYGGTWDPDYVYLRTGRILATTFAGLQVLADDGCGFELGPEGSAFFSQVAVGSDDVVLAAASSEADSHVYRSTDNGDSFTQVTVGENGDWWQTLEIAPGDPSRVYLSGYRVALGFPKVHLLLRSDDGGVSFMPLPVGDFVVDADATLEIAAISPTDPDLVMARATLFDGSVGDAIYLSRDAGETWTKKLELDDETPGILIRPDGTIYVAQRNRVLPAYVSVDGGETFTALPLEGGTDVHCLRNAPDGSMFVCAHYASPDNLAVGSGSTWGMWTPRFQFEDMAGPIQCPDGTVQKDTCQDMTWCGLRRMYGVTSDEVVCEVGAPDASTGDDGGVTDDPAPSCCGAGRSPAGAMVLALVGVVPLLRRRRRRRQR